MSTRAPDRERVDVWLWRARFAKTRAAASRMLTEGGVRLMRDGASRTLEKASAELAIGDALSFRQGSEVRTVRVEAFGSRRGPASEARQLYSDLAAQD